MVEWGQYAQAYKAIHDAILSGLAAVPEGKKITKNEFSWNEDGTLASIEYYDGNELLFTLTFEWNENGTLKSISRS